MAINRAHSPKSESSKATHKADYLFEVSWEVCNKVGGIYTVIKSKALQIKNHYGENYIVIGPYFAERSMREFDVQVPPAQFKEVFEKLKKEGITCYYGTWLIKGNPIAILLDHSNYFYRADEIKEKMWYDYQVDSLHAPGDYTEPVVWSIAAGRLIEELSLVLKGTKLAHCHEWLAGSTILHLKKFKADVATVFTTHATILGRTLSSVTDLYQLEDGKMLLERIDPDREAYNHGIAAKHQLEKKSAEMTDVFTTVSEITGVEATYILKRKPDVLVPNGLDVSELPNMEDIPVNHRKNKARMREFLYSYFFPYYSFDMNQSMFFFISGRYEFRNKGIDVTIKALGRLNQALKDEKSPKTIVLFLFIPAGIRTINLSVVEQKAAFEDIRESVEEQMNDLKDKIIYSLVQHKMPSEKELFDREFSLEMREEMMGFKRTGVPPVCTHILSDEYNDAILRAFREFGLLNSEEDRVKVILYPSYLSASDGLLDMEYSHVISGCHIGIFPSSYEPWGYTPLECAAHGLPSITTDLAGFGQFVKDKSPDDPGIYVVARQGKNDEEVAQQIFERLHWYTHLNKMERIKEKIKAEHFLPFCDWDNLVAYYLQAHNLAIDKVNKGATAKPPASE